MRLNSKKTKFMVVSRYRTSAPGYDYLTLGGAELEEVKGRHILGVTFDSKLNFEMHLQEVVLEAARNLGVVHQAGKLFDCPYVLKGHFNAYALSTFKYCAPM